MSIEAKLEALTDALKENSDLLRVLTAKAKGATATSGSEKGDEKGDKAEGEKGGDKAKGGRPAGSKNKDKAPTPATMKEAATNFLNEAGEDEEEYGRRKKAVMAICKKFDAQRFTEIEEDNRAEALKLLKEAEKAPAEDDDVV